jgi:hypothetical protein
MGRFRSVPTAEAVGRRRLETGAGLTDTESGAADTALATSETTLVKKPCNPGMARQWTANTEVVHRQRIWFAGSVVYLMGFIAEAMFGTLLDDVWLLHACVVQFPVFFGAGFLLVYAARAMNSGIGGTRLAICNDAVTLTGVRTGARCVGLTELSALCVIPSFQSIHISVLNGPALCYNMAGHTSIEREDIVRSVTDAAGLVERPSIPILFRRYGRRRQLELPLVGTEAVTDLSRSGDWS